MLVHASRLRVVDDELGKRIVAPPRGPKFLEKICSSLRRNAQTNQQGLGCKGLSVATPNVCPRGNTAQEHYRVHPTRSVRQANTIAIVQAMSGPQRSARVL